MQKLLRHSLGILFFITFCSSSLNAVFESDGSEEIEHLSPTDRNRPFFAEVNADAISKAKFRGDDHDDQFFKYSVIATQIGSAIYYNPCYKEGAGVAVGYNVAHIDWHNNPYFFQSHFHILRVALGGFSERLQNWLWKGQVAINMDTDHFDVSDYAYYDFFFWGKYAYCCDINLHVGLLVETGMKIDHVYPILGFDWTINDSWILNVVYPTNISLVYLFDQNLSAELATRFFDNRYRVGPHQPLSKGLICYRTTGVELGLNYDYNSWLSANIHGGTTLGANLKVANRHNKRRHHFRLKPSGYFGAELEAKF